MRRWIFALATMPLFQFTSAFATTEGRPVLPEVRVRVLKAQKFSQLEGVDLRHRHSSESKQTNFWPGLETWRVEWQAGPSKWKIQRSQDQEVFWLKGRQLDLQGRTLRIGGQTKFPSLRLRGRAGQDRFDVIALVPFEDYLAGVLASEVPVDWPLETLKAQAVAAKSYALSLIEEKKRQPWHLESTVEDQVYRHLEAKKNSAQKIKQAIQETRSWILKDERGRPLRAYYHSDCGGQTIPAKEVWGHSQGAGTVRDQSCPSSPRSRWSLNLSEDELQRRLGLPPGRELLGLELLPSQESERVQEVLVTMSGGWAKKWKANEFRLKLGSTALKSTLFQAEPARSGWVFRGQGYGHGVGLCQWGSRTLGLRGVKGEQILRHYYPLAKLDLRGL